ncbi:MAG: hypothetical protein F6K30_11700 [Cyanothece sp. SIO2G6]|nr:hypothetical protein [Cyanothece sp. SIO2G6]
MFDSVHPQISLDPNQGSLAQPFLAATAASLTSTGWVNSTPAERSLLPPNDTHEADAAINFWLRGDRSMVNSLNQRGTRQSDRLVGGNQADRLNGLQGSDALIGKAGGDRLVGAMGNDRLFGGSGDDVLLGGKGRDRLNGGSGDDILEGGQDRDWYQGGGGADIFRTRLKHTSRKLRQTDRISGFQDGRDQMDLRGIGFDQLEIRQGTGKFENHTLIQQRDTGNYWFILENIDHRVITTADIIGAETATEESTPIPATPDVPGSDPTATPADIPGTDPNLPDDATPTNEESTPIPATPDVPISTPTPPDPVPSAVTAVSVAQGNTNLGAIDFADEAAVQSLGGATITIGSQRIYTGYRQVSSSNQDPIIVSFDDQNPANNWVRTDYEVTGSDSRGYGLFWSGADLYGVFSIDGTQGDQQEDFRRVSNDATTNWIRSYGQGGGARIAVVGRLDLTTGALLDAAYISAVLTDGRTNSLKVADFSVNASGNVLVQTDSRFYPRNVDGSPMLNVGDTPAPFDYTVELTPDLNQVISTRAVGVS